MHTTTMVRGITWKCGAVVLVLVAAMVVESNWQVAAAVVVAVVEMYHTECAGEDAAVVVDSGNCSEDNEPVWLDELWR